MSNKKQVSDEIRVRITYYRKKKGLTQNDVADAIGMARSTYSYYESKAVHIPEEFLNSVAKVLEISPNTFNVDVKYDNTYSFINLEESKSEYKNENNKLTDKESLLVALFRSLPDEHKDQYINSLIKECNKHFNSD